MKLIKHISAIAFAVSILAAPLAGYAADEKKADVKPYKLDKCVVSDEKLGEMGKPYVMEYKGQEIKFCCKSCKKDFDKNPEKFIKKMQEAEKKQAAKPVAPAANKPADDHAGHNH
jgi:YHS domain-containing protein